MATDILDKLTHDLRHQSAQLKNLGPAAESTRKDGNALDLTSTSDRQRYLETVMPYIQDALRTNRQTEWLIVGLLVGLFLFAIGLIVWANVRGWGLPASASVIPGLGVTAVWPINQLLRIRQRNIALATAPIFLRDLAPDRSAAMIEEILLPRGTSE